MQVAGIADVKSRLSEYLARVRGGEEVVVTDRGRPVARIVPMADETPHLSDLERRGLLRRPTAPLPEDFLDRPRPTLAAASALAALVRDRQEGR